MYQRFHGNDGGNEQIRAIMVSNACRRCSFVCYFKKKLTLNREREMGDVNFGVFSSRRLHCVICTLRVACEERHLQVCHTLLSLSDVVK